MSPQNVCVFLLCSDITGSFESEALWHDGPDSCEHSSGRNSMLWFCLDYYFTFYVQVLDIDLVT